MRILILSTSLNPVSRSRVLARRAGQHLQEAGVEMAFVDLQDLDLPPCNGGEAGEHAQAAALAERVREADGILVATPIYNYDAGSACKNVIELTGAAWEGKAVGFMCAAGGQGSYMAVMGLANSLMLDFRCVIVPRFVFATGSAFRDGQIVDAGIDRRIGQLCDMLMRLAGALRTGD